MSSKQEPRIVVIPVLVDLSKRRVPSSNEPFACWIDGQVIPVTSLVLNMQQPSFLDTSTMDSLSTIIQVPASWEVEGETSDIEVDCMRFLHTCFHRRKECKVEFVNTNVNHMQRFTSKGILTTLTPISIDYHFTITGTAELIETME